MSPSSFFKIGATVARLSSCSVALSDPSLSRRKVSSSSRAPIGVSWVCREAGGLSSGKPDRFLQVYRPGVHFFDKFHGADTGFRFAVDNCPGCRRRTAVFRQERIMHVDTPRGRQFENRFRQDPPVGNDHDDVRAANCAATSRNSGVRIFSAASTGMCRDSANLRTGETEVFWPRPALLSGWVTTPTTVSGPLRSCSRVAAAICGVPMKMMRQGAVMIDSTKRCDLTVMLESRPTSFRS